MEVARGPGTRRGGSETGGSVSRSHGAVDVLLYLSSIGPMEGKDQNPWRTLEELAGSAAHEEWLHREFAPLASEWPDGPSRRNFLKLMGASVALAGASGGIGGCGQQP